VVIEDSVSKPTPLDFGVPQGSVLGPKDYTMYTKPLGNLIRRHKLAYHMYADDTQLYLSFEANQPDNIAAATLKLEACLDDICDWMSANMLKLNCDKTEVMFFASKNTPDPPGINIRVGATPVIPSSSVRNLGVITDKTMTMDKQVTSIMRSCYS